MNREEATRELVHTLIHFMHKHKRVLRKRLDSTGVYEGQHRMLMTISDHDACSQKQLSDEMHVSTATTAVTLKKLEKGGYVKRIIDDNDNRYNKIGLTKKGEDVVEESIQIFRQTDTDVFEGFSEEELERLMEYFGRMSNNLNNCLEEEVKS